MEAFDNAKHENRVADYYRQQVDFKTFDRLIDMALDGQISTEEAIESFKHKCEPEFLDIKVEFEE